ncbi:MAG: AhpC/TSA family protein [Solirubrobacteraceae bacterium]|nr:AhpC/TSA family protein [Solirubrobacteraceae bacterium]
MNTRGIGQTSLVDDSGVAVRLEETWGERPVALVFLRHFGCSFCREHAADLQQDIGRIRDAGGDIVAIGMGTPAHAADFRRTSGIDFGLLVAPDTTLHQAAGLAGGNWLSVLGPRAWPSIVRVTRKGHKAKRTGADMSQLGGTFVIDTDGAVVWEHRARHSGDNSSPEDIVNALQTAGPV